MKILNGVGENKENIIPNKQPKSVVLTETGDLKVTCQDGSIIEGHIEVSSIGTPEEKAVDLTTKLNTFFEEKDIAITAKKV